VYLLSLSLESVTCATPTPDLPYECANHSDWTVEETLSAVVMQSEMLLVTRNVSEIATFSAGFLRTSNFLESRRDAATGMTLFLTGPSSNLLAPSFGGWPLDNGKHAWSYLTGVSVTYTAALNRLIECEKLMGNAHLVALYTARRDLNLRGLAQLFDPTGAYFVRSLDPNGTMHGVVGQNRHGYFEASPNHDAVAFRIVDDTKAASIFATIDKLGEQLRPNVFMLPNTDTKGRMPGDPDAVGYDDMACGDGKTCGGIFEWGTWVNGGVWTTTEARAVMAYLRLNRAADALASAQQMITRFASVWRMDNPLVNFGLSPYQPTELINQCVDNYGNLAALVRGQFEYLYTAETLTLLPHLSDNITVLKQNFGIRWGAYMLFIDTDGLRSSGIAKVMLNSEAFTAFNATTITLTYATLPTPAPLSMQAVNSSFLAASTRLNVSITFQRSVRIPKKQGHGRAAPLSRTPPPPPTFPKPDVWHKADALQQASGSPVMVWANVGALGGAVTADHPSLNWTAPVFVADAFGPGMPAVRFSGVNSVLNGTADLPATKTMIIVFRDSGSVGTCCNDVLSTWTDSVQLEINGLGTKQNDNATVLEIDFSGSGNTGTTDVGGKLTLATIVYASDGTTLVLGPELCDESSIGPTGTPGTAYSVGARNNGDVPYDRFFKGDIAEVMVFASALTTPDLKSAASYLAEKWGLNTTSAGCRALPNCTTAWNSAVPPANVANLTAFSKVLRSNEVLQQTLVAEWVQLTLGYADAYTERCTSLNNGTYVWPVNRPAAAATATLTSYINTWNQLYAGLQKQIATCGNSTDPVAQQIFTAWLG
jgi:hypothetical protein